MGGGTLQQKGETGEKILPLVPSTKMAHLLQPSFKTSDEGILWQYGDQYSLLLHTVILLLSTMSKGSQHNIFPYCKHHCYSIVFSHCHSWFLFSHCLVNSQVTVRA